MRLRSIILGVGALLILPTSAWAADGDIVRVDAARSGGVSSFHYLLCDTKTDVSTECSEMDILKEPATGNPKIPGTPSAYSVAIEAFGAGAFGCSGAYAVAIKGANTSSGTEHTMVILDSTTSATTISSPPPRYLSAELSTMTDCTNLDVRLILHYEVP